MKKWLRIILLITCFVGLTSFLRTQAQEREASISTATLQDKTGGVVTEVSSHQPQDLQLELAMEIPEGETVVMLDNEDNAKFKPGEITDLDPDKDITAEVDEEHQLLLNNEQEKAQNVKLTVPIKLADPLLIPTLLLKLKLGDTPVDVEGIHKIEVKAEENNAEDKTTEETVVEDKNKDTSTKKKDSQKTKQKKSQKTVTPNNDNNTTKKVAEKATKEATTEGTKATDEVTKTSDAKKSSLTKTTLSTPTEDPATRLTGENIKVHQGQVQIGSWSEKMDIGGNLIDQEGVEVIDKTSGPYGKNVAGFYVEDNFRKFYYVSYQQKNNALSHAVALPGNPELSNQAIVVYYPEVGAYTASSQAEKPDKKMGAIVKISNIKYRDKNKDPKRHQEPFIDFSSNFYSGIVYNGIEELNIDITFTNEEGTRALEFPEFVSEENHSAYFTFGSLNGNKPEQHEWAGTRLNLPAKLSEGSFVQAKNEGWYEGFGKGVVRDADDWPGDWGDFLGAADYEKGAVSFPLTGVDQQYMLRSELGFTWQSFSTGSIVPLEPDKPTKTVHTNPVFDPKYNDLDGATINRDENDLNSFYYTVYQPTYSIPNESVAKPNKIILTDRLPDGTSIDPKEQKDFVLYNTNGEQLVYEKLKNPEDVNSETIKFERGTLTVKGQNVMYELSSDEIGMLDFNGDPFAFQMRVTFDDDFVGTFRNRAKVAFNPGERYEFENETNEVVTHFHKGLTLKKLGDLPWDPAKTKDLEGVVFNVTSSDGKSTKFETGSNGELVLRKLDPKKTYTITEEVPKGYVSPQEFTLAYNKGDKRWEIFGNSAQVVISGGQNNQVITVTNKIKRGDYQFKKIDGTTDNPLAGAEFIIRNKAGKYLKFDDDRKMTGVVDTHEEATRLTSTDAAIKVTGLPYGKYKLIEAKAPDGYVVGTTHKFTVSEKTQDTPELIKNDPYSLPVTGGRGIFWFISLGLILTLSALAIWRTHPRGG